MSRLPRPPTQTMALVASSSPKLARPRLTSPYEALLLAVDQARAACYASMEDLADQLETLAERISASVMPVALDETWDDDSLVTNLAAVRQTGDLAAEARAAMAAAEASTQSLPRRPAPGNVRMPHRRARSQHR